MEEQNHLVKLACVILFVGLVVGITMYNVCRLMDDREKQLQAIEADNATLRLELASMSDAYQADMASMNDAIIQLNEQIKCVIEEMATEKEIEEEIEEDNTKSEANVPTYTLQNTETTEEVPPIIAAATRDDDGEENYSPAVITETYDKFIEVDEEELVEKTVVEEESKTYLGTYQLTAYEWTGSPCANGNYPTCNYTVACNSLPLGTHIYIEGYGDFVVEDRGGMSNNVIDIYMGDVSTCLQFGRRSASVWLYN